jgi:uncharacterized glyoxalase superfamily protein PhnB
MAIVPFGSVSIIFDEADEAAAVTIAFASDDCDADFRRAVDRGAKPIEPPTDRQWGPVRSAYVAGPGRMTIEIEQVAGR